MRWNLPCFAVLLAIVLSLWLWPSVFAGKALLPLDLLWQYPPHTPPAGLGPPRNCLIGDMLYENFTWKTLLGRCPAGGEWPLWNPYVFCGHPLYATGQASTFYPFNLIFLVLSLPHAYVVFTALHLWLGGVFQIGVGGFGAAVGGVIFAMCGFFALRLIWPMLLGSAIWLPLMLLWIIRLSESEDFRQAAPRIAGGAVIFALPLLSGFFEIAFYAYVAAGLFTLARVWRLWRSRRSVARCAGLGGQALAVVLLAVLLAGPQLLPFLEVKDLNIRAGQLTCEEMLGAGLNAEHLLPVIVPDIFGHPAKKQTWDLRSRSWQPIQATGGSDFYYFGPMNYSANGYFIGLLPLLLAPLSLRVRGHHRLFLYLLLALSLSMAFGTWIYALFFYTVPGFDQVRTPFRWMYVASFVVASLAAIGAGHWQERLGLAATRGGRLIGIGLLVIPAGLLLILLVLLVYPDPAYQLARRALEGIPRLKSGSGFLNAWDLAGFMWANFFRFSMLALAGAAVLALGYLRKWSNRGAAMAALACFAMLAIDAGQASYRFNTHSEAAWLDRVPPAIRYLQDDAGVFRIARFGPRYVLYPNLPLLYGLHDVGGYDSILLSDYIHYLNAIEPQHRVWWNLVTSFDRASSLDSPLLSLLNIRYLLTGGEITHPDWELVFEDGMRIYRSRRERPRAFMVHRAEPAGSLDEALERIKSGSVDATVTAVVDGRPAGLSWLPRNPAAVPGKVSITRYAHCTVELATSSEQAGIVVLCDIMYPGWRVYVDGSPDELFKADGIFRGVWVPAGEHQVLFRFEPAGLRRGWIMLGCGLFILVAAAGWSRLSPRRECGPAPPAGPDGPPTASP